MNGPAVVLGGSGFLGRHVCAVFADAGHPVSAICRRSADLGPGVPILTVDLARAGLGTLASTLDAIRPAMVVNAAGAVWGVTDDELVTGNVVLVRRLVETLRAMRHRPRLIHIGSVNEFAPLPHGQTVTERSPVAPATRYGQLKLLGTEAVLHAARDSGLDALVLRMTNLIGPGMPAQSLLGQVARQLWQGARRGHESTIRLAPLTAYRDYLDVRDAAAVILAAAANRATGVALTVGSGRALSVRFLVDLLIQVSGQPATIVERPDAGFDPRGPGWLRVDATTARDLLGWAPRHTVEDAVRELWNAGLDACDERVEPVG